jgi:1-acyl-sn-glycerol-3-phosphate acyltransferase
MEPWRYEPARDLDQSLVERLRRFPREPDMLVYGLRSLVALAIRAWLKCYHRLEIIGKEHLPCDGSFVVVANHASHLDALCLLAALPLRKLHRAFPAAAQDYFFVSLPRVAVAAIAVNALPFARQLHVRQSLDLCRQLLANPGNILIIFPEGTRSTTGQIGEFRPGIGMLVAGSAVPVVPCHLTGAAAAWPKGSAFPRPRRVQLRVGTPVCYESLEASRESALQVARSLKQTVEELALSDPTAPADRPN